LCGEGTTMDDEIKTLLREILQTQKEHLKAYREVAERSLGLAQK
jgi:sulfite reductase alpha subunit-like flavoprotein